MKIDSDRLRSETKKIENVLGRKQFKRGYENEFQNVSCYDQILYSIGATPTYAIDKIFSMQQVNFINKMMDKGLIEVCDFYNQNKDIVYNGLMSFEGILRSDNILEMTPTYQLNNITYPVFKELLLEYFSQYGNKVYGIVKKYVDEGRIELGDSLDPTASGVYFGSNITKSGYITIQKNKKLSLYTLSVLAHELGHAVDFETLHYPQGKNMNLFSDLLIEVPSIHFEVGFLDFLLKNNIYPNDARALMDAIYQELSFWGKSFYNLYHLDDFYIEDGGYVSTLDGKFIDYEGNVLIDNEEKDCCEHEEDEDECDCGKTKQKKMDVTELIKYGLGMYIALQTNELASQDREAYMKELLKFTTGRKESSFVESLEKLGISQNQFETASIIEPRIKEELVLTRKMWNFK